MLVGVLVGLCCLLAGAMALVAAYHLVAWRAEREHRELLALAVLAVCQVLVLVAGALVLLRPATPLYGTAIGVRGMMIGLNSAAACVAVGLLVPGVPFRVPALLAVLADAVRVGLYLFTRTVAHPVTAGHWPAYGPLAKWTVVVFGVLALVVVVRAVPRASEAVRLILVLGTVGTTAMGVATVSVGPGPRFEALATLGVVPSGLAVLAFGALRVTGDARARGRLAARQGDIAELGRLAVAGLDPEVIRRDVQSALARTEAMAVEVQIVPDADAETTAAALSVHGRHVTAAAVPADRGAVARMDPDAQRYVRSLLQIVASTADRAAVAADAAHTLAHDEVTGLANRVLVVDRIDTLLTEADEPAALVLCGLTRFEEYLATAGIDEADRLAVRVARRLEAAAHLGETIGRLAPGTFAAPVRLTSDDLTGALTVRLGEFETALRDALVGAPPVGTALGAAVAGPGTSALDLIRDATAALARSASGGGAPEVFDAELGAQLRDRLELEHALTGAVQRGEIVVHYQPILDVASRRVTAYEALARWRRGTELVPPDRWIPLAEGLGTIDVIGREVLRIALRDQPRLGAKVTVNVSPRQLAADDFVDRTLEAMRTAEPGALLLEVTESAVIVDHDRAVRSLTRLREHDIRIALDDFGTSYSSLGLLASLPVDGLKIDRVFVEGLAGANGTAIVAAIVALARRLGKVTVVEGVETAEQFATLAELGVDRIQGFLIGRREPIERIARC